MVIKQTVSDQIKILCVRSGISCAELARRLGKKKPSFYRKLNTNYFTTSDLEAIAEALGAEFHCVFVLPNGEEI